MTTSPAPRPVTYDSACGWTLPEARHRCEELTGRDLSARSAIILRQRGEFDPADLGHRAIAEAAPLTADEHLELVALGEVLARHYRHPTMLDHALKAGATFKQLGAARGTSTDQARQDYRAWVDGQHGLFKHYGKFGLNDQEYTEALARLDEREAGE